MELLYQFHRSNKGVHLRVKRLKSERKELESFGKTLKSTPFTPMFLDGTAYFFADERVFGMSVLLGFYKQTRQKNKVISFMVVGF